MTVRPGLTQQPIHARRVPEPAAGSQRKWLLFVHQLPSQPSHARVTTWRRLQQIGAIPIKQAVYALPDTPDAREDFEWLAAEVKAAAGEATIFAASSVDAWSDDALVEEFRRTRQEAYAHLAREVEQVLKRAGDRARPKGTRAPALHRLLDILRERLVAAERIDFFGSAGRDRVLTRLRQLEDRLTGTSRDKAEADEPGPMASFRGRLWVTRPRPGVDRMASAWLIRRFIDREARFAFAAGRESVPEGGVPFDMFGVEFTHQGEGCTFETLCSVFGIHEPALPRLAAIVHDLDLKDGKFGAPECGTVGAMIDGLQLAHPDDDELLERGITMFDALYRSFERSDRSTGPRLATRRKQQSEETRNAGRSKKRR